MSRERSLAGDPQGDPLRQDEDTSRAQSGTNDGSVH